MFAVSLGAILCLLYINFAIIFVHFLIPSSFHCLTCLPFELAFNKVRNALLWLKAKLFNYGFTKTNSGSSSGVLKYLWNISTSWCGLSSRDEKASISSSFWCMIYRLSSVWTKDYKTEMIFKSYLDSRPLRRPLRGFFHIDFDLVSRKSELFVISGGRGEGSLIMLDLKWCFWGWYWFGIKVLWGFTFKFDAEVRLLLLIINLTFIRSQDSNLFISLLSPMICTANCYVTHYCTFNLNFIYLNP